MALLFLLDLWEFESQAWTIYVCMCGMWFTNDIVINDINLYEVMLVFMIMLIEYDVAIEDDIDNNWYEIMLLLMIMLIWDEVIVVDNFIEMRWCWCRE